MLHSRMLASWCRLLAGATLGPLAMIFSSSPLWASLWVSWISSHHDVWIPRARFLWGQGTAFFYPVLRSHSHFHQTLLVQKVIETQLVSKVRGGELAKRNVHSTSWWGHGMVIEEVWVGRYCCFHVCKIQCATPTYLLRSLSGSVSYSHCSHWDLIMPFSCSAIRDIVLHSSHTRFVLWSCKASWSLAICNILCNNLHDMYGIIYGGTVKHSLLWPKLRKGWPKILMLQMLFYLRLAKITWQDIHISCNLVWAHVQTYQQPRWIWRNLHSSISATLKTFKQNVTHQSSQILKYFLA